MVAQGWEEGRGTGRERFQRARGNFGANGCVHYFEYGRDFMVVN